MPVGDSQAVRGGFGEKWRPTASINLKSVTTLSREYF